MYEKITKCPNFTWFLPEKLTKLSNFTRFLPEKMAEFCMVVARKIFSRCFFLGGGSAPCPPSPTPMDTLGRSCACSLFIAFVKQRLQRWTFICFVGLFSRKMSIYSSTISTGASYDPLVLTERFTFCHCFSVFRNLKRGGVPGGIFQVYIFKSVQNVALNIFALNYSIFFHLQREGQAQPPKYAPAYLYGFLLIDLPSIIPNTILRIG